MTSTPDPIRGFGRRPAARFVVGLVVLLAATLSAAGSASAYWSAGGSAFAVAVTGTLAGPVEVTVPETATLEVPVIWGPGVGGIAPSGYYVTRHGAGTSVAACLSDPMVLTEATTCTDGGVPEGEYSYVVTAVYRSWTASSTPSGQVIVAVPSLLGAAKNYSVLAATSVVSTGETQVSGDLGVSPGTSVVGFGPGIVGGDIHGGDASAVDAQAALAHAYSDLASRLADTELAVDLGGLTLNAGVYHSTAALALTGTVTLDGQGNSDALFVFQSDAAFNTAAGSGVALVNGAQAANVYWVVTGAAGTGANSLLSGTIVANGAITLGAGTELIGRALSRDTVTLAANIIRFTVGLPATVTIDGGTSMLTKDPTPTVTGTSTAPASSPITVTVAGHTTSTTVSPAGTWEVTTPNLTAGTHQIVARVREANGNGNAAFQTLTVEVNPPLVLLGSASTYSVLAGTGVVTTGHTTMTGDLGVSPSTEVRGFEPGDVGGVIHAGDLTAAAAQADLLTALDDASLRSPHTQITGDLGTRTFHVGVHHTSAALALTGTVTLDAEGDPDAVFIFQTDAAFNTAAASTVNLVNGAQASNVFWCVTGAAGTGANSTLAGIILARGAITLGAGTSLSGQALSRDTITLAGNLLTGVTPAAAARLAPSTGTATEPGKTPDESSVADPAPGATDQPSPPPAPSGEEPLTGESPASGPAPSRAATDPTGAR